MPSSAAPSDSAAILRLAPDAPRPRAGEALHIAFDPTRALLFDAAGLCLFAVTGTLGGHLAGAPTAFSQLIAALGWKLYNTFYLPTWVLLILALLGLGCALAGMMGRRRSS